MLGVSSVSTRNKVLRLQRISRLKFQLQRTAVRLYRHVPHVHVIKQVRYIQKEISKLLIHQTRRLNLFPKIELLPDKVLGLSSAFLGADISPTETTTSIFPFPSSGAVERAKHENNSQKIVRKLRKPREQTDRQQTEPTLSDSA